MRTFLRVAALVVAVVGTAEIAAAKLMIAPSPPARRAIMADITLVGKVTGIEKEPVMALPPYAGAKDKVAFQIATVKVETGLIGAEKLKEIKIGTILPPKVDPKAPIGPRIGGGPRRFGVDLKEGQELLLFLVKHPTEDFYTIPGGTLPVDIKTGGEQAKKDVESVKQVAAILADPAKALKSDKPDMRAEAATVMVLKYRNYPVLGGEVDQVAIGAEESKTLLKGLTEGNWSSMNFRFDSPPSPLQAFQMLGLTDKDGWIQPVIVNTPGAPPVDFGLVQRDAYMKWLEGPGKNYVIKKMVPKAPK
ncbi:MAG: hypothetical protein K8U57_10985 [Planctomycetes bacterium]|nr:hypothetical protein [Planctomycetota bacterium]